MQRQGVESLKQAGFNTDTGLIRLIAILTMAIDHVGVIFFSRTMALRVAGRIAFPLFCYGIVVGSLATHDWKRYALRLLSGAVISQVPYMVAVGHSLWELNVMFTLLLGLLAIEGVRENKYGSAVWGPVACLLAAASIRMDYGWKGVLFILLLYMARGTRGGFAAVTVAFCMYWGTNSADISYLFGIGAQAPGTVAGSMMAVVMPFLRLQTFALMALPFILLPTNSGIRLNKWLIYAAYPGHFLLLYLIRMLAGA